MSASHLLEKRATRALMSALLLGTVLLGTAASLPTDAMAAGANLYPNTKIRISVVHWAPIEGTYRAWSELGGEFLVGQDGGIALPVVGVVAASTMDSEVLADEIANRLKNTTGMVAKPEVTVSVIEYAPVYVLGAVTRPGEYRFSEGLDVLRATAMGGGPAKEEMGRSQQRLQLVSELRLVAGRLALTQARIDRYEAELDGRTTLAVPRSDDNAQIDTVYAREQSILSARSQEMTRQTTNMQELLKLFEAEIVVLEQKRDAVEASIETVERQLKSVTTLVERGVAVISRQSDMERDLANLRSDRLDHITSIMKARQGIAETTRDLQGLKDRQMTEVATSLQAERENLRQATMQQETQQKLLLKLLDDDAGRFAQDPASITYVISRMVDGHRTEVPGEPTTAMLPGDVLTLKSRQAEVSSDEQVAASYPVRGTR